MNEILGVKRVNAGTGTTTQPHQQLKDLVRRPRKKQCPKTTNGISTTTKTSGPPIETRDYHYHHGGMISLPDILRGIFLHVDASDFQLAAVCKAWASIFNDKIFWRHYCGHHWRVKIDQNIVKDVRKYIFERFNLENLSLRMCGLTRAYHDTHDRNHLTVLRSLMSHEEFISETKECILGWLSSMGSMHQEDKRILTNLLKSRLCYEDYDKFVSQDGGAWFGEGWNGSYRIYDNKGSYTTVSFDCYCHPGHEKEHLRLSYKHHECSGTPVRIISADGREDESSYIYDSNSVQLLRSHLQLHNVSLTNLFCFLLFSMGKLLDFYRFSCLGTDQFSEFWHDLEKFEHSKRKQDCDNMEETRDDVIDAKDEPREGGNGFFGGVFLSNM